jgi:hypothetical protein
VFDTEQQPAKTGEAHQRTKCCADCAFRAGSPERADEMVDDIVFGGRVFACHKGMRRVVAWVHPSGARVDAEPGDYQPLIVDGVVYRANGAPAAKCAGVRALRLREGIAP